MQQEVIGMIHDLSRQEWMAIIYVIGTVLTFCGGMFSIRNGWWKESGSVEPDGLALKWKASTFDALFTSVFWFIFVPIYSMLGITVLATKVGDSFLNRTKKNKEK